MQGGSSAAWQHNVLAAAAWQLQRSSIDARRRMALACLFCGVLPSLEGWPASSFSLASCRTRPGRSSSSAAIIVAIVVVVVSRRAAAHRAVAVAIVFVVAICWKNESARPSPLVQ
jgi:lysylphosphatidylglycerol synthetase-like protein (DUF2156 family)